VRQNTDTITPRVSISAVRSQRRRVAVIVRVLRFEF
jgi:hypothetical protein